VPEFSFDADLTVVIRVTAETEREARAIVRERLCCVNIGYGEHGIEITEGTLNSDAALDLFEIDQNPV